MSQKKPVLVAGDWQERAACRTADPTIFNGPPRRSPEPGERKEPASQARRRLSLAKAHYCDECPVGQECMDEALKDPYMWGIRNGQFVYANPNLVSKRKKKAS